MSQREILTNGNAFKRTDGRWGGTVWYLDEKGERKRKSFSGTTKAEVNKKMKKYIVEFNQDKNDSVESLKTLEESLQNWLQVFKFPAVERTTYDRAESIAKNQIYPQLGKKVVGNITAADIKKLLNYWMTEGYAYTTVKKVYTLLNEYFRYLYQQEIITKNPMANVEMLKKANFMSAQGKENLPPTETITVFSEEEIEKFKAEAFSVFGNGKRKYQQAAAYILMLNTGLRTGEALGLLNSDIDLENRVMHVQRGVKEVSKREGVNEKSGREVIVGKLKSATSKRDIPLNDTAIEMIKDLRKEFYFGEDTPLIPDEHGEVTRPVNFRKRFYRILTAAGIETKGLHSLRHTFATRLINGVKDKDGNIKSLTPKQVADLLGHTTSEITELYYVKRDLKMLNGINASDSHSFDVIFRELQAYLDEEYGIQINCDVPDALGDVLKDRKRTINAKFADGIKLCGINKKTDKRAAAVMALICGKSESASVLFDEEIIDENGKLLKIELKGDYETKSVDYAKCLGDKFELIEKLKAVYDWAILADVLGDEKYISFAKVKSYHQHGQDLKTLKAYVKQNCPEKYREIFKISKDKLDNYTAYSGMIKKNGKTGVLEYTCNQEAFCKYLLKCFKGLPQNGYEEMFSGLESASFMPKQHIKDNGVIPLQINRAELEKILENASGYLPFLNEADESGKTVADKIRDIFNFRIPYYVGPLNNHSDKAWLERKEGKIYPWNFSEMVDVDRSAENFINNLTSKCTYLPDKDVIPKNSVLYCKFTVLNELNNLRINGEKISVELKKDIFNDLFLRRKKVTQKGLTNYLKSLGYSDVEITGVDGDFKSSMKPYIDLCEYGLSEDEMERIILAVTIFGDDKRLLKKRLKQELSNKLTDKEINKISHLQYSGWGRLSREFLCDIEAVNPETGEVLNIINALWETNDNLMILLGSKYQFSKALQKAICFDDEKTLKEMVDSLYVSPSVKRPILQSIKMLNEVVKALGKPPKKIFVEMTRGEQEKKRTVSRKDQLLESYKTIKKDAGELYNTLNGLDNDRLRQDKLYLYFTQLGKCMYTGESIAFDSLFDNNLYDIDHIYPRSKVKDDSLNNRVLVKKKDNAEKDNTYPLSQDIRRKMLPHWKFLLDKGLINKEKFKRLTRVEPLTDDELSDFISRQIVETSQSTKAVAQILDQMYSDSDVVYVKARNVSEFRHNYDMLKCREVNDLHHAKDAYLNIVVGNVYDVLYTRNKANFIAGLQTKKYSLNQMFSFNIKGAWAADKSESLNMVKRMMNKNNIIYTRYTSSQHGSLFKLLPLKKGSGQVPLTNHGARSDIEKYGGYDKPLSVYFTLVKHTGKKGKECISMQPINLYQVKEFEKDPIAFLKEKLGLIDPEILVQKVKYNSCIEIDGFRMHISGKQGASLSYKPGMQLVLGYQNEKYIRNISKYLKKSSDRQINESDHLNKESNLFLFDLIISKMTETVLRVKFKDAGNKIKAKRDSFIALSTEDQCFVIMQMLHILRANVMPGDLTKIGLVKSMGKLTTSIDYSIIKGNVKIINQSVTGLYENEIVIK